MFFRSGKKTAQDVSINEPIDTDRDGNTLTLMDTMAVDDTIVDSIDLKLKSEKLCRFIGQVLTPREREIVCMRYGLGGRRPLPQRVAAKRLGISRSYVSRIEKKALEKLRARFEEEGSYNAGRRWHPSADFLYTSYYRYYSGRKRSFPANL